MFNDSPTSFPDDKKVLGHYLGPSLDIGSTSTAKISKENGEVICCTTFCQLPTDVIQNSVHQELLKHFNAYIPEKLGPAVKPEDLPRRV